MSNLTERRRQAARRAFWSDHPLNLMFRRDIGRDQFSLAQFIAFVERMPADRFVLATAPCIEANGVH